MKLFVDKGLLSKTVDTLRDVSVFMGQGFHNRAKEILGDVLSIKNEIENLLIVNPDTKTETASKIIDEMLKIEVKIFGEEWQLETEKAKVLRNKSDRLKNQLLNLLKEN